MMTFGPFAMTFQAPQQVPIPANTVAFRVMNRSPYDLWVAIGPGSPPIGTQATVNYFETVPSGRDMTIVVPAQVFQQAGGSIANGTAQLPGPLWLIPTSDQTAGTSGLSYPRNSVYVTAFLPDDSLSADTGMGDINVTSQGKTVALPLGARSSGSTMATFGATGTSIALPPVSTFNPSYPLKSNAGFQAAVYIHYLQVALRDDNTGHITVKLQVVLQDIFGSTVRTLDTVFGVAGNNPTNQTSYPWVFAPPEPWVIVIGQPNVANLPCTILFQLTTINGTASMTVVTSYVISVDAISGEELPDVGTSFPSIFAPPGTGGTGIF